MQCQRCKKQAAVIHLTDIEKGETRERHLCEQCATEEGVTHKPAVLNELVTSLLMHKTGAKELAALACPHCKMTFVDFRNGGLLGCPHDYDAFDKALTPLIERAHEGSSHHVGKIPRRQGGQPMAENDLIRLRQELNKAVTSEQYEKAAELRDRIRVLESE